MQVTLMASAGPSQSGTTGGTDRPKILIADDHALIRDALAEVIRANSPYEVLVADSFTAAKKSVAENGPIDILLLDLYMPDMEGIKSIEKAIALPGVGAVAVISGNAPREIVLQAMARGAKGYIPKNMRLAALMTALNFIALGEIFLPASFAGDETRKMHEDGPAGVKSALTNAEIEVLRLVVAGLPNKEIARRCGSTEVRVKMHVRAICRKLGVPNRTSAAIRARDLCMF